MKPKEGDKVRIKSGGGPIMVVGGAIFKKHECVWWDEKTGNFCSGMFYLSQLEVVEENK